MITEEQYLISYRYHTLVKRWHIWRGWHFHSFPPVDAFIVTSFPVEEWLLHSQQMASDFVYGTIKLSHKRPSVKIITRIYSVTTISFAGGDEIKGITKDGMWLKTDPTWYRINKPLL